MKMTPEQRDRIRADLKAAADRLAAAMAEFGAAWEAANATMAAALEPFVSQTVAVLNETLPLAQRDLTLGLSVADMDALKPGQQVIDAQEDVSTKRADGLWEGIGMAAITSAMLHKYGPIRLWTGVRL